MHDVRVGTIVRVPLAGRRVGGWVTAIGQPATPGVVLRPIAKVTGEGPPPELVDLAGWAAWRWAGRRRAVLTSASPPGAVRALPARPVRPPAVVATGADPLVEEALSRPASVLRLPPSADAGGVALAVAAARPPALVVCPSQAAAQLLVPRLRRAGLDAVLHPGGWAAGAAGATVVGARGSVWAPVAGLRAVVVLDEHDEALQEERNPTWHARDVALERARRAGVPCLLVSPCPTLEAQAAAPVLSVSRTEERAGWAAIDVVDQRSADPRTGLFSDRLVALLRDPSKRVACVLNRTGRARLLACSTCKELTRCERCGATVGQVGAELRCARCATVRPVVCQVCTSTRLKALRLGTERVRDELAALAGDEVLEVTAATPAEHLDRARLWVGTEAVLHRVAAADVVAFLDLDQELLAPRARAAEQALALLARASRLVGGRHDGGRVLVQTRLPGSEVLAAARLGDPARVSEADAERRRALGLPPYAALALVSGPGAPELVGALPPEAPVAALGPSDGRWLLRAPDAPTLADALAATPRPSARVRVEVDPLRA